MFTCVYFNENANEDMTQQAYSNEHKDYTLRSAEIL